MEKCKHESNIKYETDIKVGEIVSHRCKIGFRCPFVENIFKQWMCARYEGEELPKHHGNYKCPSCGNEYMAIHNVDPKPCESLLKRDGKKSFGCDNCRVYVSNLIGYKSCLLDQSIFYSEKEPLLEIIFKNHCPARGK